MSSCRNEIPMPLTYVVQNILYFKLKTSSKMIWCSSASFCFVLFCCSLQSAEASLKYLDPGYFLGKVCFMVTNGRATVKILLCVFLFVLFCFMFCFFPPVPWFTGRREKNKLRLNQGEIVYHCLHFTSPLNTTHNTYCCTFRLFCVWPADLLCFSFL